MRDKVLLVWLIGLAIPLSSAQRVYVFGSHGYAYVAGVDKGIPRTDAAGHDQTMELAKTFLQRCPDMIPTTNRDRADFIVQLNWTSRTRMMSVLTGGKLLHKPDQIWVTNKDGDIIYSSVARSVGGDVDGACKAIRNAYGSGEGRSSGWEQHRTPDVRTESKQLEASPLKEPISESRYSPDAGKSSDSAISFLGITSRSWPGGGAEITAVAPNSPAQKAGLQVGYVIHAVDQKKISTANEFEMAVSNRPSGATLMIDYSFKTAVLGWMPKEVTLTAQ
jgi:hypothetical protein